jgi:hypothetical protein
LLPFARRVGRDFEPIAAELHATPAARSFLAGVLKKQHAAVTLANAIPIGGREQLGYAVQERSK